MSRWFRVYDEAIHDAKVLLLPSDALRWQWIVLLAVASLNKGKIPSVEIAALALRVKPVKAAEIIAKLNNAGLLDAVSGGYYAPHNWEGRQYRSDKDPTAAERQKRYRERHQTVTSLDNNATSNALHNEPVTRTEADTETESDTEQTTESPQTPSGSSPPKARKDFGTRISDDWLPSTENRKYAIQLGFFSSDLGKVVDKFRAHFAALPGKRGLSADWSASWTKFVLDEARFQKVKPRVRVEGEQQADAAMFVSHDTEAGRAWLAHYLKERGRKPMTLTRQGHEGSYFPSEFPPGYESEHPAEGTVKLRELPADDG